jgi:RND family efflux transporter MFP subunit
MLSLALSPRTGFGRVPDWRLILVAAVAATVALAAFSAPSPAQEKKTKTPSQPPTQVGVDTVITEPLRQTVPVIGRFVARQTGVVAARVSGPVGEIRVRVGDRVKADDVITVLINDMLKWQHELQKAKVQQYAAAVKTRKTIAKLRRQELRRIEKLIKSAAFSKARLDDKRQEVAVADSQAAEAQGKLNSARANLKMTGLNLYNAAVRAPYSGVISKRHIEVGAYVNLGDPLVTLVDDAHLEIEADVPANRTPALLAGTRLKAYINGTQEIAARVRAVVPEENPQTRTRTVRFVPELPLGISGLASNQSVTLQLPAGNDGTVVTVHKDAILSRKGKTLVFLVQGSKAVMRPVRLGEAVGIRFIVNSGLAPGDKVVVRGNERLLPGQAIRIREPSKPAKAGG